MKTLRVLLPLLFCIAAFSSFAQQFKPGFDIDEFSEVYSMSVKYFYPKETGMLPDPIEFKLKYTSDSMGLDNKWQLWVSEGKAASISIRGTSGNPESWLENFYAAMVPAKGSLKLEKDFEFDYTLASNPRAAVHVGWLIATAYLSSDILPKIDSCYQAGIKNFYINGHSQGGAISYLMTAHLYNLRSQGKLPQDIHFKTYASAAPKPGNQYFAYDYNLLTQDGWGYNIINPLDWVPETFLSVQKADDFNEINVLNHLEGSIKTMPVLKRTLAKSIYKNLKKPSSKAQKKYQKYFGKVTSKLITKYLPEYQPGNYYASSNYVLTGNIYVLKVPDSYVEYFNKKDELMLHHKPEAYYYLMENYKKAR
jgi:hypothetical protein